MAEIKKSYNSVGEQIYLQTHEKAVVDNNGTTAETKFQMITELINQKQMEVGAVPSDLAPTKGSTNWVTSGGVYDGMKEISDFTEVISPSLYTQIRFIIHPSTGKWLTAESQQGSKLVAIPSGVKEIILSPNSDVMMWSFLSAYTPAANNTSASVATGTDNRYSASEETRVSSWGNGKFILVRDDIGQTNAVFPNITFVYYDHIEARLAAVQHDISELSKNAIADDGYVQMGTLYAGYVQDNGTWLVSTSDNTHLSAHYGISVMAGDLYRIDAGNSDCEICWATSHETAVNGEQVPMVGAKITIKSNTSKVVKVPSTALYMLVMASCYTKDIRPSQIVLVSNGASTNIMNVIPDYIVDGEELINLDELTEYDYTMYGHGVWGGSQGRHKAFPVVAGEKYVISGDGNGFWAWLTSSYSPPVTSGSQIPFVTGYTNRTLQKGAVAVTVPNGAAYLAITIVNGSGGVSNWEIFKVSDYKKRSVGFTKFRYAHWNIGQFLYTDWTVGGPTHKIPAADAETYAKKYRSLFNSINSDVLGISEYNPVYSAADWTTKNVLFQCFRSMYEGTKTGANSNSIAYNLCEFVGVEEIDFTASSYNRYYTHMTVRLNGENIHLIQAHLDHTYNEMRVAEINQLIAEMSPYKYVIIAGDFNTGDEETIEDELSAFTDAGYTMLNDGYLGLVITSLTQEYVDNIVVKGFTMSNINVRDDSGTLSDHLLIYCDLTMN